MNAAVRLMMKTTVAVALLWILYASCAAPAEAVCAGTSVSAFGAKGDGHTDDTAAIQSAIRTAAAAGGGSVVFNVARYFTTGTFVVPTGVVLCGAVEGPPHNFGADPAVTVVAPTLLITNTSAPFVTLQGVGSGVTDLLFHYPNQVSSSASAPNVYPYTIVAASPGTKVVRSTATNAYDFLDIESGRVVAQDLLIGAFNIGINVDHAHDHVTVRNVENHVFWDLAGNPTPFPHPIDNWVMNHGIALVVNRVDGLEVNDFKLFWRFAGMLLTDSSDSTQNPRCGDGTMTDVGLDQVQFGIIVTASNAPGYEVNNLSLGSAANAQAAVQLKAGGSIPPNVLINGSKASGAWALGPFPTPAAGNLTVANCDFACP